VIVSLPGPAQQELVEASQFYAREGGAALGEAFIAEFERWALLLAEKPMQGAPFHPTGWADVEHLPQIAAAGSSSSSVCAAFATKRVTRRGFRCSVLPVRRSRRSRKRR
jgi:hypothetical protein